MHAVLTAVLAAWLQYAADGSLHARAIATGACPSLTTTAGDVPMTARAQAAPAFANLACDAPVAHDGPLSVDGIALAHPPPTAAVNHIVVLGDTGCRIKKNDIQACNDPAAWPFPRVAAAIAAEKPDLIVHVGDYLYRESPCPPNDASCAGSPNGDTWATWNADFFTPASPLLHAAPIVFARGNHESCTRGGNGWFRYLEPTAATSCVELTEPYAVDVPGLRMVVFDDSYANDATPDAANVPAYARQLAKAHALAGPDTTWFVTHRPPYMNATLAAASTDGYAGFQALIVGHVHVFGAFTFDGHPPLVINGMGGDELSRGKALTSELTVLSKGTVLGSTVDRAFGYAVYDRVGAGWRITLHAADASVIDRCTLANNTARCDNQTNP
jgi:predicted phosphodiesterase